MSTNLQITLKKQAISMAENGLDINAYPIVVSAFSNINLENDDTAITADGYPCNIFTLQRNGTGLDPNQGDRFVKVATALDIEQYPAYTISINASTPETSVQGFPFYRYHTVKLYVDNPGELEDIWAFIKDDADTLVQDYNRLISINNLQDTYVTGS